MIILDPHLPDFPERLIELMRKISELGEINFVIPVFLSPFCGFDTLKESKNTIPIILPENGNVIKEVLNSL